MLETSLLKKTSARLDRVLEPVCQVCDKVRRRFVREAVWSILASAARRS